MRARQARLLRLILIWIALELIAAWQIQRPEGRLLTIWTRQITSPIELLARSTLQLGADLRLGLGEQTRLVHEHQVLEDRHAELQARLVAAELEVELLRQSDLTLRRFPRLSEGAVAARVIARSTSSGWLRLDRGLADGVRRNSAVLAAEGLLGRVVSAETNSCWVEPIDAEGASVAVISSSGQSGLAVGRGKGGLRIEYLPQRAEVFRDELFYSSGEDGLFPPGLPVGRVDRLREGLTPFLEIEAVAEVDPRQLHTALVLRSEHR